MTIWYSGSGGHRDWMFCQHIWQPAIGILIHYQRKFCWTKSLFFQYRTNHDADSEVYSNFRLSWSRRSPMCGMTNFCLSNMSMSMSVSMSMQVSMSISMPCPCLCPGPCHDHVHNHRHAHVVCKINVYMDTEKESDLGDRYCLWAYGSGSQCRPNWMHIGSGETQEGSGFWVGGYIGG